MKTPIAICLAGLLLAVVSISSFAGAAKKKTMQTQVAAANYQVSIKHLRLRMRSTILVVNQ